MRLRTVSLPLILLAAGVVQAACTISPSGGGAGPDDTPVPTTPFVDRSSIRVPTPKGTTVPTTLTGRVTEGVEAGCTVLRTADGRTYTLTGELRGLALERQVTVRGHIDPNLMSHCMQGPVFVVSEVVPATP